MEMQNIFYKKIKRKNFFSSLAAAAAGYIVLRSTSYKLLGKRFAKNSSGSDKIKIRINSLAVSRQQISARQKNIGDRNV
jgi:hypothetical protein